MIDEEKFLAKAVALFEQGKLAEALALFHIVAAAGGNFGKQAQAYIDRITAKQAGAESFEFESVRKGRNPFTGEPTIFKVRPRPEQNQCKTAKKSPGGAPRKRSARRSKETAPKSHMRAAGPEESAAEETVRRTPHMDISVPLPLEPSTSFDVIVFADQQSVREDEESMDVVVPADTRVQVHLIVSDHFLINGPDVQPMIVSAKPRSDAPPFHLSVKPANELPAGGVPQITALFMHEGRPCGMVRRRVEIVGIAVAPSPPTHAQLAVMPLPKGDLHITIVATEEKDGRTFTCLVQTPHLQAYREEQREKWVLKTSTKELVDGYMKQFTNRKATPKARVASLRGAGKKMFRVSPKLFREVFWELIDAGAPLRDIAIVSEEPYIPWELMIPNHPKGGPPVDDREPLGVEFRVGRWIGGDIVKPQQKLKLIDSYIIAPNYKKPLQHAMDEANFVANAYAGEKIVPACFDNIQSKLKTGGKTLLHFVCHGLASEGADQTIELENGEQLTSTQIEGMGIEEAFNRVGPIVFLNACEVGRPAPALVGLGGFAASFIQVGASAVIAPLWSVKDSIAHEIAMEFYQQMKDNPETPFAEILRTIRKKTYQDAEEDTYKGEDTYAAYCFYGDPAAIAVGK